jgi:dTDP-4-dehydrorhamnose reductase
MRALLLGPNGQLGADIRRRNEAKNRPLTLLPFGRDRADLSDVPRAVEAIGALDFDALVNCSSYHKTDEVETNAQLAFTINAHLPRALAELCARKNARFVHVSTDYVFGGQKERAPLKEDHAKAPLNVYGASKGMGEDLALATGEDVLILRVASLFGVAGASGKGGNFVETMIKAGRERGALRVVDDQIMSPTSTADIADALLALLAVRAPAGVYHAVNSEGGVSWCAFAREIIRQSGVQANVTAIPSSEFPTPAKRPPYSALDNAKLAAIAGPMPPWPEALARYLRDKGHVN